MFKMMTALIRGRSQDAADAFADANALTILRQQLRDAADGLEASKRALAVVMAYSAREKKSGERIAAQLADLEERAVDALRQGKGDLAGEAAAAIADLEAEQATVRKAAVHYDGEIRSLREQVSLCEQRLRVLQRGKQIADAADRTHRLRGTMPGGVVASLRDAEETLARLQLRQQHAEDVEIALVELNGAATATTTAARLAAAGCGAPLQPDAAAILERLRAKAQ